MLLTVERLADGRNITSSPTFILTVSTVPANRDLNSAPLPEKDIREILDDIKKITGLTEDEVQLLCQQLIAEHKAIPNN